MMTFLAGPRFLLNAEDMLWLLLHAITWLAWYNHRLKSGMLMRSFLLGVLLFSGLGFWVKTVAGYSFSPAAGPSMLPTFPEQGWAFVSRRAYGWRLPFTSFEAHPDKGDVVWTVTPASYEHSIHPIIKRVVAVGGDTVNYAHGQLRVNGVVVPSLSSRSGPTSAWLMDPSVDVTVADGYCFVMGDNRSNSMDSRDFGAVPCSSIEGKVWAYWSHRDGWKTL